MRKRAGKPKLRPSRKKFAVVRWEDGTTTIEALEDLQKIEQPPPTAIAAIARQDIAKQN